MTVSKADQANKQGRCCGAQRAGWQRGRAINAAATHHPTDTWGSKNGVYKVDTMCEEEALKAMRGTHTTMHGIRQSCYLTAASANAGSRASVHCHFRQLRRRSLCTTFSGQATNGVNAS